MPLFSDCQRCSCRYKATFILRVEVAPPVREWALTELNNGPCTCFISWHLISCFRRQFRKLFHKGKKVTSRIFVSGKEILILFFCSCIFTKLEILSHHLFSKITIHLWGRGNPILIYWSQDTMLFFKKKKKCRPVHRRLWNKSPKAFWKGKYQVWFLSLYSII